MKRQEFIAEEPVFTKTFTTTKGDKYTRTLYKVDTDYSTATQLIIWNHGKSNYNIWFLNNMNRDEYVLLKHSLEEMKDIIISYNNSTKKIFDVFQEYAPNTADKVSQELKDFDIDKYEQVINIARAAGAQF